MKSLYGLDLGNGDIKVVSSVTDTPMVFPSVVGKLNGYNALELGSNNRLENLSVLLDGEEYAVGKMALKNSTIRNHDVTDDKYLSESTKLLAHTALSLTSESAFSVGGVVIGLPIHKMDIAKKVTLDYRGNKFGVKLGYYGDYETKLKLVQLEQVIVVAQPHGTLFNIILDDNGQMVNKDLAGSGIAIFDIGYKTNDGVVFKNLDPIGRLTIHSKSGMHVAYEEIRSVIGRKFNGLEVQTYEVPEIVRTGTIRGNNVKEIVNRAFYNLALSILNEIKTRWEDAWEVEHVIFTGGGAELLKPYLKQVFSDCIFPDNCQTSNAEGFLKYAKRLWGAKNDTVVQR
jgi:plasmid segregation protein ParM